jgi:hypothetical protein
MAFFLASGCFSWFLGVLCTEVDDARDGSCRRWFTMCLYLAAKSSHVGLDVDGLACPYTILCPATTKRGDRASCQALSCPITAVGFNIWWRVDRLGTCVTEFYMEYIVFTRICLPYDKANMTFMHVSLV